MAEQVVRVDVWIWSVRLAPSRAQATAACKAGHVRLNGQRVKPASRVAVGDTVRLSNGQWPREVVVTEAIAARVGASRAVECYEDHSPQRPKKEAVALFGVRDRGAGRPTKKDKRQIDKLRGRTVL